MSIYLQYGNFSHDPGDAEVSIARSGIVSELGVVYAVKETWNIRGRLHANTPADVNAAVLALYEAYSVSGLNLVLVGTEHGLISNETINGTRVTQPPSFPEGKGAELSTYRTYTLAVEGEYAYWGDGILLSWNESLNFRGDGGPVWGFLECLNGPPQQQQFQQASVLHCKQSGSAVCTPPSIHRNDYGIYWQPPQPAFPQWEHTDRRDITYEQPADLYGKRVTKWSFEFSSNTLLAAYPNGSGVISHLG